MIVMLASPFLAHGLTSVVQHNTSFLPLISSFIARNCLVVSLEDDERVQCSSSMIPSTVAAAPPRVSFQTTASSFLPYDLRVAQ